VLLLVTVATGIITESTDETDGKLLKCILGFGKAATGQVISAIGNTTLGETSSLTSMFFTNSRDDKN